MRPTAAEREEINRIIMDELVYGVFKPEAVAYFQRVIGRMKDEGCDAVVLGCTEIPLIMNDANSPLPTLDSTRLLARAALRRAIRGAGQAALRAGLSLGAFRSATSRASDPGRGERSRHLAARAAGASALALRNAPAVEDAAAAPGARRPALGGRALGDVGRRVAVVLTRRPRGRRRAAPRPPAAYALRASPRQPSESASPRRLP